MCTRGDCQQAMGQWVTFRTNWGTHRGIVEQVNHRGVLVKVPQQYAPVQLAGAIDSDEAKLDAVLAWGRPTGAYGGYGNGYNYGRPGWGYPGYGAWGGGWWWWWLAFAWIFLLAFLW